LKSLQDSDDLFEERPQTDDSPFGDVWPAGYQPLGLKGAEECAIGTLTEWGKLEAPKQKFDATQHYERAMKMLRTLRPGKYWKADYIQPVWSYGCDVPALVSKDMLGFADVLGICPPNGHAVAGQITTRASMGAHLRKYTNPSETHGQAKIPIEFHLREFLQCGGEFILLGFFKDDGSRFWRVEIVLVSEALLDIYVSRKRRVASV
jgi:hypothetical protein